MRLGRHRRPSSTPVKWLTVSPETHDSAEVAIRSRLPQFFSRLRKAGGLKAQILIAVLVVGALLIGESASDPKIEAQEQSADIASVMPADVLAFVQFNFSTTNSQSVLAQELLSRAMPIVSSQNGSLLSTISALPFLLPTEMQPLLSGEAAIAISDVGQAGSGALAPVATPSSSSSRSPGYVFLIRTQGAERLREGIAEIAERGTASNLSGFEVIDSDNALLLQVTNEGWPEGAPSVAAIVNQIVILGTSLGEVAPFAEAVAGEAPVLADSAEFQKVESALPSSRLVFGYVNGPAILADLAKSDSGNRAEASIFAADLGISEFAVAADEPGFRLELAQTGEIEGDEVTDSGAANLDFASHIPDSVWAMANGQNLGSSSGVRVIEQLVAYLSLEASGDKTLVFPLTEETIADQMASLQFLLGFNPRIDIVDNLRGQYGVAAFAPESGAEPSSVLVSDLVDPDQVASALTNLGPVIQAAGEGQTSVTTVSIADSTVANVDLVLDNGLEATVQYGVVDDRLMVGTGDGIQLLVAGTEQPLSRDSEYRNALSSLPANYDSILYVSPEAGTSEVFPVLESVLTAALGMGSVMDCSPGLSSGGLDIPPAGTPFASTAEEFEETGCGLLQGLVQTAGNTKEATIGGGLGPFVAVSYREGDLFRSSGILVISENS
jgi:hypothetical protein